MLKQFYKDHLRVQALREGPGGPLLEGFAEELYEAGYAEITAAGTSEQRSILFIGRIEKAQRSRI